MSHGFCMHIKFHELIFCVLTGKKFVGHYFVGRYFHGHGLPLLPYH